MGIEDFHFAGTKRIVELADKPDIVHCHNLHGELLRSARARVAQRARPVVITMHDAWLLSGHCVHSLACERWETGCGKCPDLTLYPAIRRDATAHNWQRKRRIYRASRLHVGHAVPWLMDKVQRSISSEGAVSMRVIPHGIDLTQFKPIPKLVARAQLGIPDDADVLVFAANGSARTSGRTTPRCARRSRWCRPREKRAEHRLHRARRRRSERSHRECARSGSCRTEGSGGGGALTTALPTCISMARA